MLKVLFLFIISSIGINILNSYYIPKCKMKMEKYFHALLPSVIALFSTLFYFMLLIMFKISIEVNEPINIISNIIVAIVFLIINAFVVISNGIDSKKDNEVTIGLLFIFCLPILFIVSIPLELTFYILLKLRKTKDRQIKVTEEEIFEDAINADDYSNNEISVSEYINQFKYNL